MRALCRVSIGRGRLCPQVADSFGATRTGFIFRCPSAHTFNISKQEVEWAPDTDAIERQVKPRAVARRTDPETSKAAAKSIDPSKLTTNQIAVRTLFEAMTEMTDHQLVKLYHAATLGNADVYPAQSDSGLRTRRGELRQAKVVRDTGRKVEISGRRSIIWGLVAA